MQLTTFKEFTLYAAHKVACFGEMHKCAKLHGHSYKVRIESDCTDPENPVSFDQIESTFKFWCGHLDHSTLNDTLGENPTTEVLALYIAKQLTGKGTLRLRSVEVKETESAGAKVYL